MITREWLDNGLAERPDNKEDTPEETKAYFTAKNIEDMYHMDEMFEDRGMKGNRDFILGYATSIMDQLEGIVSVNERIAKGVVDEAWTAERVLTLLAFTVWQYLKDLSLDQDLRLYGDVTLEKMVAKFMEDPVSFLKERAQRQSGDTDQP